MKIKKAAISILLVFAVVLSNVGAAVCADNQNNGVGTGEITDNVNEILLNEDFESYKDGDTPEYTVSSAKGITVSKTEEHGNVMSFYSATGSLIFNHDFGKKLGVGTYLMSFDFSADGNGKLTYVRLRNISMNEGPVRDNYFETIAFNEKMRILTYPNTKGWTGTDQGAYVQDEWYHVDMWLDLNSFTVYYYINNEFVKSTSIHTDMNAVAGFQLGVEKAAGSRVYIDNLKFTKVNYADKLGLPADAVPSSLKGSVSISMQTGKIGNIFTQTEIPSFEVGFKNRGSDERTYDVTFSAVNEDGAVFWSKTEKMTLDAFEQKTVKTEISSTEFGCNMFYVSAVDTSDSDTSGISREFSYINSPSQKNSKWGATIHTQYHYNSPETVDIMAKSGMGYVRTGINWASYETAAGKYKIPDEYKNYFQKIKNSGMEMLTGVMGTNSNVYPTAIPPATEQDLKIFGDYVYNFTKEMSPYSTHNEVWNEYNLEGSGFNPNSEPPEKYAEMLKTAYKQMKAVNPDSFVIGFVTSGTPNAWIERVFKALDGEDCFDAISVHPYSMRISPEDGNLVSRIVLLKELMQKYGYDDKELWATEIGWPNVNGYVSVENQARYNVRTMLLNDAHDLFDRVLMYQVSDSGLREDYSEHHFGLVKSWFRELDVPYAAKPAYAAMSNFNMKVGNAEFEKTIAEEKSFYAYKYKNGHESDKNIIVAGSYDGTYSMSLKLGCDSVTVYDMYGNAKTVTGTNGDYTFVLGEDMCYIEGDFGDVDFCNPVIETDTLEISTTRNTKTAVVITADYDDEITADVINAKGMTFTEAENLGGGKLKLKFTVGDETFEKDKVKISVNSPRGHLADMEIPINYLMSATIESFDVAPYSTQSFRHLTGIVKIKNNRKDLPINGELVFSEPARLKDNLGSVTVTDIGMGETQNIRFNIPENWNGEKNKLSAELILSNGEKYSIEGNILYSTAAKINTAPTIDGVISPGEWDSGTVMILSGEGMSDRVSDIKYGGPNDLSGKAKLTYDDEYLYFMCDVQDNVFSQKNDLTYIWKGDGIQFGFAYNPNAKTATEVGLALTPAGAIAYGYSSEHGYAANQLLTDFKVVIVNSGEKTVYETAIPWSYLLPEGVSVSNMKQFYFSMLINDNDGGDRLGWLEYGSGIGRAKSTAKFVKTVLVK